MCRNNMETNNFHHALKVKNDLCYGCTHCVMVCPTEAIRVINGKATINGNRCVDCGECMNACPADAIIVEHDDFNHIFEFKHRILLVPAVFIGQFPEEITEQLVYSKLIDLGFTQVFETESTVEILNQAMKDYLNSSPDKPLISSFCPAVIRLIQVKFPGLVDHILQIKPPIDVSALFIKQQLIDSGIDEKDIGLFYATPCAAKIAAIKSPVGEKKSVVNGVINMNFLFNKVYLSIKNNKNSFIVEHPGKHLSPKGIKWTLTNGESDNIPGRRLAIDGIHNVIEFLEKLENEDVGELDFLELRACDESCAGGILTTSNRFLTVERLRNRSRKYKKEEGIPETDPELEKYADFLRKNLSIDEIAPRSMLKLDEDMAIAMEKMEKARRIHSYLPKIDCGACGAPSCAALAEDIVQKQGKFGHCVFIQRMMIKDKKISIEKAIEIVEDIWGKDRLNNYFDKKESNDESF
jgi:iron only hydrogenase large subunit-like protein